MTAKAQRKFAEDHTHIRMKEILHHDLDCGPSSAFEGPFGARTQLLVLFIYYLLIYFFILFIMTYYYSCYYYFLVLMKLWVI